MSNNLVEVSGITPRSQFPKCLPNHPSVQFCEIDKLYIPCPNPSIHDILEVCVNVVICSTKEICTPIGKKLVIDGKKQIKVNFSADDPCHSVHSAHFDIPFCTFILLGETKQEILQVCTVVEDIAVKCLDCRCLTVTSIIFICPEFKKKQDCYPDHPKENDNCKCGCHEPCASPTNYSGDYYHPHDNFSDHSQPAVKKYYSGVKCQSCGLSETIRADRRYYYGR